MVLRLLTDLQLPVTTKFRDPMMQDVCDLVILLSSRSDRRSIRGLQRQRVRGCWVVCASRSGVPKGGLRDSRLRARALENGFDVVADVLHHEFHERARCPSGLQKLVGRPGPPRVQHSQFSRESCQGRVRRFPATNR